MGSAEIPQRGVSSRRAKKLVGKFDRMLARLGDAPFERFGEEAAAVMQVEMLDEYRRLLPQLPYIGGRRNMLSETLVGAVHRVVIRHGGTAEDTGELIHRVIGAQFGRIPKVLRHLMGRYRFSRLKLRQFERAASLRHLAEFDFEIAAFCHSKPIRSQASAAFRRFAETLT